MVHKLRSLGVATALVGLLAASATAQGRPSTGPIGGPGVPGQTPGGANQDVQARIRQIIKDGRAAGLTNEQIKANVDKYLASIGMKRPKP